MFNAEQGSHGNDRTRQAAQRMIDPFVARDTQSYGGPIRSKHLREAGRSSDFAATRTPWSAGGTGLPAEKIRAAQGRQARPRRKMLAAIHAQPVSDAGQEQNGRRLPAKNCENEGRAGAQSDRRRHRRRALSMITHGEPAQTDQKHNALGVGRVHCRFLSTA